MAHDRQYKEPAAVIGRLDYPKTGDRFYNRHTRHTEVADHDMDEQFLIITGGDYESMS